MSTLRSRVRNRMALSTAKGLSNNVGIHENEHVTGRELGGVVHEAHVLPGPNPREPRRSRRRSLVAVDHRHRFHLRLRRSIRRCIVGTSTSVTVFLRASIDGRQLVMLRALISHG